MSHKLDIQNMDEKKLRNLKINLNNRLVSFGKGGKVKELSPSHKLYGMSEDDCNKLLTEVKLAEKELRK